MIFLSLYKSLLYSLHEQQPISSFYSLQFSKNKNNLSALSFSSSLKRYMGNCASPQYKEKVAGGGLNWTSPAKIVHIDGRLQEFREPIKASNVLSLNPNSFLCSSESMYIDRRLPQVPDDEELQVGQLYFLMPLSKSKTPLSLQELCALASKANASLAQSDMGLTQKKHYRIWIDVALKFWPVINGAVRFRFAST